MENKFADVHWQVEDILTRRPDWTDEQCAEFLSHVSKYIQDAMIETGWEVIDMWLPEERGDG